MVANRKTRAKKKMAEGKKPSLTDDLLKLAEVGDFFHTPDGRAFVTVPVDEDSGRRATFPVRSKSFREWLAHCYYLKTGKGIADKSVQEAISTLAAKALYDGQAHEVYCRVSLAKGHLLDRDRCVAEIQWLDLGDDRWLAVMITASGWKVMDSPAVRFRRTSGMKPIAEPRQGGNLDELWKFLNVRTEDRILVAAWLSMALRPAGPYPVLAVRGEQGSAKSMLARCLRHLVDPNRALLRGVPRSEHDLFVTANRSWIIVLDNISFIPPWLSDALCRIATGGGFATRELYTDDEETIFDATRPIILTGIGNYIEAGDLRDRAIFLDLPQIPPERRKTERDIHKKFEEAAPRLLGALLDLTYRAMKELPNVRPQHLSRMADFDAWGEAVERSGPWQQGEFQKTYQANRAEASHGTLDDDVIAEPLRKLLEEKGGTWAGTCKKLGEELARIAELGERKSWPADWPRTHRALSNKLARLTPNLRVEGIEVTKPSNSRSNGRVWTICTSAANDRPDRPTVLPDCEIPPEWQDGVEEIPD